MDYRESLAPSPQPSPQRGEGAFSACGKAAAIRAARALLLDHLAGLPHPAAAGVVALHLEIDVGIVHPLGLRARADLQIKRVLAGLVDQAMADAAVGLPAGGIAGLQHGLAVVLVQHQLTLEHVDELVLALMPVPERRLRVRLDARDIDAKL